MHLYYNIDAWPQIPPPSLSMSFTCSFLSAPDEYTVRFPLKVVTGWVIVLKCTYNLHTICPVGHEDWPVGQLSEFSSYPLTPPVSLFSLPQILAFIHSLLIFTFPFKPVNLLPVHESVLLFACRSSESLADINCICHTRTRAVYVQVTTMNCLEHLRKLDDNCITGRNLWKCDQLCPLAPHNFIILHSKCLP